MKEESWREKYAQLKAYDGRSETRGKFIVRCTGANKNLYTLWYCQIGLNAGRCLVDGWKRELLEKAGVDFDLDWVRAAINDMRDAASRGQGWQTGQV